MSSAVIQLVSFEPHTKLYYAFFLKEWLQFIKIMKQWGHSQGCYTLHTWADEKIWKSVLPSRASPAFYIEWE